jgi:hypothetical protein
MQVVDHGSVQQRRLADPAGPVQDRQARGAKVPGDDLRVLLAPEEEVRVLLAVRDEADVRRRRQASDRFAHDGAGAKSAPLSPST